MKSKGSRVWSLLCKISKLMDDIKFNILPIFEEVCNFEDKDGYFTKLYDE